MRFAICFLVTGAASWGLAGCGGGGGNCTPNVSITCVDGKTYWIDSCGNLGDLRETCECGCRPDGTGCADCGCEPDCFGKECGPDGCGGVCGNCTGGKACVNGLCICESHDSTACHNGDLWWFDSCGNPEVLKTDCESGCSDGQCNDCAPDCTGLQCGPDPVCGASCGTCPAGESCVDGQCTGCTPDCEDRECGDDGCGGSCGTCPDGESCSDGQCVSCTPDCAGKDCGPDGCGGSCGTCPEDGMVCEQGQCVCQPHATSACFEGDVWWFDSCGNPQEMRNECEYGCQDGACTGCTPDCEGKQCGDDGCGGSCGQCPQGMECQDGICACQSHAFTDCFEGDVWWFDSCGNPEEVRTECTNGCTAGQCNACQPDCTGLECGDDGCGGSCGTCEDGTVCEDGVCVCGSHANFGCYQGDVWWYDSCGELEDMKEECAYACEAGACVACTPDCTGLECGDDGCGGSCGNCEGGQVCQEGTCVCGSHAYSDCYQDDVWWFDSCGEPEELKTDCSDTCTDGQCTGCTPDCTGKECGDDGCGGSCGSCDPLVCSDQFTCICESNDQCGAEEICINQGCDYAYGRMYTFEVVDILVYKYKPGTEDQWDSWAGGYDPDPQVCFFQDLEEPPDDPLYHPNLVFCTTEGSTESIGDWYYAAWNETFDTAMMDTDDWMVVVYDLDTMFHDKIDHFRLNPWPAADIKAGESLLNGLSSSTLLYITPQ